jgi:hypothetical protein
MTVSRRPSISPTRISLARSRLSERPKRERLTLPGRAGHIRRLLTVYRDRLYHTVSIENFALEPYSLDLGWYFGADFVDVIEVRLLPSGGRWADPVPGCLLAAGVGGRRRPPSGERHARLRGRRQSESADAQRSAAAPVA